MLETYPLMELAVALAVGLLIGLERGWKDRSDADGTRVAGFRTIGLIGLLGGLAMMIDNGTGFVLAAGFIGLAVLLREGFEARIDATREVSVTTMIAALIAYALGAIAVSGNIQFAAIAGVATTFLLWLRTPLHGLLNRIEEKELNAFLYWLLISIVVLPVLPNQAYGPYDAFNPRTIWLMVILISGLGFAGYIGMAWFGRRRGSILLAISGGLVSSTAATLAFARLVRQDSVGMDVMIGGVAIAWAIMLIRTVIIVTILAPVMLPSIALSFSLMIVICIATAVYYYRRGTSTSAPAISLSNPLDLKSAAFFTILLTAGLFASKAGADLFGEVGLYAVAILAGAVDIEAISLSLTQMVGRDVEIPVASIALVLAALANTLFKGVVAATTGGGAFGRRCFTLALILSTCGGLSLSAYWI
jgi:uncharacterized membrane protein (DUF4010 family)